MTISDYDVIYNEQVFKCVDFHMEFTPEHNRPECGADNPDLLDVICVNGDGSIVVLHDEAWRFRFVRKEHRT